MKVVFMDGFNGSDLSEEEIAEIKALIEEKIADGTFFTESQPVDFEALEKEDPEMYAQLMKQIETMPIEGSGEVFFEVEHMDEDEPPEGIEVSKLFSNVSRTLH